MKPLPETINLVLTEKHRDKSMGFDSNTHCIIATALKELFPSKTINAGSMTVSIGNTNYKIADMTVANSAYKPNAKFPKKLKLFKD